MTVRVGDHGGAAPEHGVAGEHGGAVVVLDQEAQRVGGVAGRGEHRISRPAAAHHVAVGQALGAEPQRRVERAHRHAAGELGEPAGALGVVEVAVGEQDLGRPGRAPATRRRCASSSGPGSTTTQPVESGARSSQVLVPSRVMIDGFARAARTRSR